ncbi:MAG: T9SS type A sorting domain-containing protein [Syntrophothermus sp.]
MRIKYFSFFLLFFFSIISLNAQVSEGGMPYSFNHVVQSSFVHQVEMPSFDLAQVLAEDAIDESKGVPLRFGYPFEVNFNMENSGTWDYMPDGSRIWRLQIHSPEAITINLVYNDFWLPDGAKFFVYNSTKTEVLGAFTSKNNKEDGIFATSLVRGETTVLEYYEPAGTRFPGRINVSSIIHGYKNVFKIIAERNDFGESGSCNNNVNCAVGDNWQNEKRGAAMILTAGNFRLCSGSMINNIRQDLKQYFLTANHCISGQTTSTWIIMFHYESPNCTNIDGPLNYTVQGTTLKANNAASDFALLELTEAIPDSYQVHFAGWNAIDEAATSGTCIHHPNGDIKKISFISVPFTNDTWSGTPANSHWRVQWSNGVTEPGSSGSPVYDQLHRIKGQLHGGPSSCTASDKSDLYGKFSMSWNYGTNSATRLKDWLDPDNTGLLILDGWDPSMGQPDTVPPTRITDLAVANPTSNSLTLTWSTPMDTSFGGVKSYKIVYSSSPITDTVTFNNGTPINYVGQIGDSGNPQSLTVTGLPFTSTYYFAIRSKDLWNNWSLISNVPSGTTLAAPVAFTNVTNIHKEILNNVSTTDSVMLKNNSTTPSTLDYQVSLDNNTFPSGYVNIQIVPVENSEVSAVDTKENPYQYPGMSIKGLGGPDLFGYKWIDSDEPNGPAYVWTDISTSGTLVTGWVPDGTGTALDDGHAGPFNIGFPFKFYGTLQNTVSVSTNGFAYFNNFTSTSNYSNATIPNASQPNGGLLAAFWDDLDGRTQGTVHYQSFPDKFIIQYTNWQKYSASGSLTFQIVLMKNGKIFFYYNNMVATLNSATVGIENQTGTDGLQVAYNANYIKNNLAVLYMAEPEWLFGNNLAGTLTKDAAAQIKLTFNSEDFPVGDYSMDMIITSNDPVNDSIVIPVSMTILSVPVELTSLQAEQMDNNVVLRWSTATEVNNRGFAVERKETGKSNWSETGFVKGNVTSTEIVKYSFTDRDLKIGKYSYRLKQIDLDGKVQYSDAIEVDVKAPNQYALFQNYPNPFNPSTTVKFNLPVKTQVSLILFNNLGEKVKDIYSGELEAGYHEVKLDASNLSSGMYIYRLNAGKFTSTKKMSVIK